MNSPLQRGSMFVYGIFSLCMAGSLAVSLSYAGFPDGYMSAFTRASFIPHEIISALFFVSGCFYIYATIRNLAFRTVTICFISTTFLLALSYFATDTYLIYVRHLDTGIGG